MALEPIIGDLAAEHDGSVAREVPAGAAARLEAGRARRLRNRRGDLVHADRPRATTLLVGRVDIMVDRLDVQLRAERLANLVAELWRQPVQVKAA
jgi:hypothetical protein